MSAARAFYDFWNTGDEVSLKRAGANRFTDRTLRSHSHPLRDRRHP